MNGKVSRRIRRAALHVYVAGGTGEILSAIKKRLKQEYRLLPYHKRHPERIFGYRSLSHRQQEQRWIFATRNNERA